MIKINEEQLKRWSENPHFKKFLRQMHADVATAVKLRVPVATIKATVEEFGRKNIINTITWG